MKPGAEIEKFIKKKLKAGYPAGELKTDLLGKGYTEDEIEKLFLDISLKRSVMEKQKNPRKKEIHVLSLLGASLLITGVALTSIPIWLSKYSIYMIVLGGIGIVAGYFNSNGRGSDGSST